MSGQGDGTRVVRAGLPEAEQGTPFLPGPVFAGPFHLRGDPADSDFVYTRDGNPTWERYERALAELEGGEVVLFASGMAAAAALLLTTLRPGSAVAIDRDCYYNVRHLAASHLEPRGVELRLARPAELESQLDGVDMLWLESPSNPKLDVADVAALSAAARERGATTVVDNTTAGPLLQRPLELGADASIVSATKHLSGHADLQLGYVATADPALAGELRDWRYSAGAIPGPFEAWLAHRSLPTLALRIERGCANALALAEAFDAPSRGARRPLPGPGRPTRGTSWPAARCAASAPWSPSTWATAPGPRPFWPPPSSSPRPPASAASTPPPNGAPVGAATTCRRASFVSRPAVRTLLTSWPTSSGRSPGERPAARHRRHGISRRRAAPPGGRAPARRHPFQV